MNHASTPGFHSDQIATPAIDLPASVCTRTGCICRFAFSDISQRQSEVPGIPLAVSPNMASHGQSIDRLAWTGMWRLIGVAESFTSSARLPCEVGVAKIHGFPPKKNSFIKSLRLAFGLLRTAQRHNFQKIWLSTELKTPLAFSCRW